MNAKTNIPAALARIIGRATVDTTASAWSNGRQMTSMSTMWSPSMRMAKSTAIMIPGNFRL